MELYTFLRLCALVLIILGSNYHMHKTTILGKTFSQNYCTKICHFILSFIVAETPDGTVFFNHDKLQSPATKDEIVEIVKLAAQNGRKIRVLGSGHSRSPLALSEDIMVSLHRFKGLVEVDLESKQVTVRAGTTLQELNGILEEKGLALTNMPAIADPTVAGAIATGKDNVHI